MLAGLDKAEYGGPAQVGPVPAGRLLSHALRVPLLPGRVLCRGEGGAEPPLHGRAQNKEDRQHLRSGAGAAAGVCARPEHSLRRAHMRALPYAARRVPVPVVLQALGEELPRVQATGVVAPRRTSAARGFAIAATPGRSARGLGPRAFRGNM